MTIDKTTKEIRSIIAKAAALPLADAAYSVWRQRYRLNTLEGRPTDAEASAFRAMSPPEQAAKLRHGRDHAADGPAFGYLKAAHPAVADGDIKKAITASVKFEDACFAYFSQDAADHWESCVEAVARAAKENPGYQEATYQLAANDVAYYMK